MKSFSRALKGLIKALNGLDKALKGFTEALKGSKCWKGHAFSRRLFLGRLYEVVWGLENPSLARKNIIQAL